MKLSDQQISFLQDIGVDLADVFDATGMKRAEYSAIMEENGYRIAYGVTPCNNGGHTLRTRSGNCVQCNPANLTFQDRYESSGWIYVARSKAKDIIKVGVTSLIAKREASLNKTAYGGCSDWVIVYSRRMERPAVIEKKCHKFLSEYAYYSSTNKHGRRQSTYELFSCSADLAIDYIKDGA